MEIDRRMEKHYYIMNGKLKEKHKHLNWQNVFVDWVPYYVIILLSVLVVLGAV